MPALDVLHHFLSYIPNPNVIIECFVSHLENYILLTEIDHLHFHASAAISRS